MKKILAKIFGGAAGGVAEKISNIIGQHVFSKEDKAVISFDLKDSHTDLLQMVLLTCIGAYFGGRSYEKIKR